MRERVLAAAALGAVALVSAAAVVLLWDGGGSDRPEPTVTSSSGIDAYADLDTPAVRFGDTVRARVELTVDRARVDPRSIRVRADFSPWQAVGRPVVRRFDGASATYLETRYTLRCLEAFCLTEDETGVFDFRPARVTYLPAAGGGAGAAAPHTVAAPWPELLVRARYVPPKARRGTGQLPPRWQAELVSLPPASYRLDPWLLLALLVAGALLCAGAAVAIVRVASARPHARVATAPTARGDESLPTPLEQALALLESPARANGPGERRRALELVADGLVRCGSRALALSTRALAWSRAQPRSDETQTVAKNARRELERSARDRVG